MERRIDAGMEVYMVSDDMKTWSYRTHFHEK